MGGRVVQNLGGLTSSSRTAGGLSLFQGCDAGKRLGQAGFQASNFLLRLLIQAQRIGRDEKGLVRSDLLEAVDPVVKPDSQLQARMRGKQSGRQIGHSLNRRIPQDDGIKTAFDFEGQIGGGFAGRALVVPDEVAGRVD